LPAPPATTRGNRRRPRIPKQPGEGATNGALASKISVVKTKIFTNGRAAGEAAAR